MVQLTDEELIRNFRAGNGTPQNSAHIDELFRRYYQKVACWCVRFSSDREMAADLAQEIFMAAYRNLDSFRGESKFSTWLYSIARNHCINHARVRASRPEVNLDANKHTVTDGAPTAYERMEK